MTLIEWQKYGWLTAYESSAREIGDLLDVVERDLADSGSKEVSADWRLNIADNAALQAATAALAASGYRASRDQHHYRIIQSLSQTIGAKATVVTNARRFQKKTQHHRLRKRRLSVGVGRRGNAQTGDCDSQRCHRVASRESSESASARLAIPV